MDIMKFEILEESDEVVKVEANQVHIRKKSGEYVIFTLKLDEAEQLVDFNVFAITKGFGSIELVKDADLNDLSELWEKSDE